MVGVDVVDDLLHGWLRWVWGRWRARLRAPCTSGARGGSAASERGHQDTRLIQHIQRHRLEHQRDRVAGQERRDRRARDDRVTPAFAQLLDGDETDPRRTEDHDRDLEDEPHREQHGRGEFVELARLHEHVELARVEVDEEAHGGGQDDEVAEQHARDEQRGDRAEQRQR